MRFTFVLPLLGAAAVTAGAILVRMTLRPPAFGTTGVVPLPVDRMPQPPTTGADLPDRLRAQGF